MTPRPATTARRGVSGPRTAASYTARARVSALYDPEVRVLVTGATGLIGRALVPALLSGGSDVVAVVREGASPPDGVETLVHDLAAPFPPEALPAVDCVVHLAHHPHVLFPEHAVALQRLNTSSTVELLDAARKRGVTRFVYASSGAVYGFAEHVHDETHTPRASDFYALTKAHAEAFVRSYAPFFATVVVRPFFPYGPGQRDRLVARLAAAILSGEPTQVPSGGGPRVNPVFVADVADAIAAAAEGRTPDLLNLAGPDVVSISELAEAIGRTLGRSPRFVELGEPAAGDLVAATGRLCAVLDRPLVSVEDGLRRTFLSPSDGGVTSRPVTLR
jgi:UDP-glucose 4-epimerase